MGVFIGEKSDVSEQKVWGDTDTVTTDPNGRATYDVSAADLAWIDSVQVTRVTNNGIVGQVVVEGGGASSPSELSLLFKSSTGSVEANVSRRVSVTLVGG